VLSLPTSSLAHAAELTQETVRLHRPSNGGASDRVLRSQGPFPALFGLGSAGPRSMRDRREQPASPERAEFLKARGLRPAFWRSERDAGPSALNQGHGVLPTHPNAGAAFSIRR